MVGRITELTELTTPADDDLLEIIDLTETAGTDARNKKVTRDNLLDGVTIQEWVPASAMYVMEGDSPAQSLSRRSIGANSVPIQFIEFLDGADSIAYYDWGTPENWNAGTIKVKLCWTTEEGSSTETIEIEVSGVAEGNDDAIGGTAFGTAVAVTDTWIADDDRHHSAQSGSITIAGTPTAGDNVILKFLRDISDDTLGGGLEFIGFWLEYTITKTKSSG